jgi:hypothetical protein
MLSSKANLGVIFGAPSFWSYADCGDWSFCTPSSYLTFTNGGDGNFNVILGAPIS